MGKDDHPRFIAAKTEYETALDSNEEEVRLTEKTCGVATDDGPCLERGTYEEGWAGDRYRINGTCEAGHLTERYGVSEGVVE